MDRDVAKCVFVSVVLVAMHAFRYFKVLKIELADFTESDITFVLLK